MAFSGAAAVFISCQSPSFSAAYNLELTRRPGNRHHRLVYPNKQFYDFLNGRSAQQASSSRIRRTFSLFPLFLHPNLALTSLEISVDFLR